MCANLIPRDLGREGENPGKEVACAPPFSLQGFPTFVGHSVEYRCARNFEIVKMNFLFTFLYCRIITHILTAFSIAFLTYLNKKTAIHALVCLLIISLYF